MMQEWPCEHPEHTWRCELMQGVYWYQKEGQQPNAFHRLMQRLFFGLKWEKRMNNRAGARL